MATIDLNVDIGEGGAHDDALLDYATSVNIACGWHAGDAVTMRRTAAAALARGIALGAHPGYPDREHFGRRSMEMNREDLYAAIQYQVAALGGIVKAMDGRLSHIKPHGALYHDAERDPSIADAIVSAVRDLDSSLAIYGLSGGRLVAAARAAGLVAIDETFADRAYRADGTLVPRSEPGAVIDDAALAGERAAAMVSSGGVEAQDGTWVPVVAQTVCLHGDALHAPEFAARIHAAMGRGGVQVRRPRARCLDTD
ncbi:5-oxoprolinase subunit PxpA [Burkholderia cepacia]|uniref:5-oxoprolinase subunit PxpA n=1 Tax=Burkholderia cepacia TaxID=292 RepID=UPI002656B374|nr:5-oxoprolinase subunit PxpA [Burkholderia cepacia]MDN7900820.1 5-oxoprolinase subunit PxpA [Burkholderia cepacia]